MIANEPESTLQDPGSLLEQASALAAQSAADLSALSQVAREHAMQALRQAIDCLDRVLAMIPPGAECVPNEAFRITSGRVVRDRRPGAFDAIMLETQRKALARVLEKAETGG